mmetsp:Transcript_23217/g.53895  ORF Transcript_23217/g.53895 Transcript_23217/m.53895 type:complete len:180 (+) Transcript_23217:206-745(+)
MTDDVTNTQHRKTKSKATTMMDASCARVRQRVGMSWRLLHRSTVKRLFASTPAHHPHEDKVLTQEVKVYSSLGLDHKISFARGWAWQQALLQERLDNRQSNDIVLLFEHTPVYTLGRGADENHLVFLSRSDERRQRLSRKCRGPGTARLSVDRRSSLTGLTLQESVSHLSGTSRLVDCK